ncbi:hypothetical protein ACIA8R_47290 [Nonomuraea sp. NPDC051191]|uniref:hypothetical protein n=1 Tax=Nonomuraea sp. NPDC051191 TaxID=3364372 RepID=UPI0037B2E2F8
MRTIAVFGLTTVGLLTAVAPATAEDGSAAAAPCVAARIEVASGSPAGASALLDTSAVRTFLQGLVRPADRPGAQPLPEDTSFAAAAEFPGLLDALLLDVDDYVFLLDAQEDVQPARTGGDPGDVAPATSGADSDALARRILEALVADALRCTPPAAPPATDPAATSAATSSVATSSAADSADAGSSDIGFSDVGWSADPEATSLLDSEGATAVLEALMNRPESCVTDGTSTIRSSDTGRSIAADSSQVSLLDALGVRRMLDVLVGRPSACATEDVPLSAATTEQDRPKSLLDGFGLGALFSKLLG